MLSIVVFGVLVGLALSVRYMCVMALLSKVMPTHCDCPARCRFRVEAVTKDDDGEAIDLTLCTCPCHDARAS